MKTLSLLIALFILSLQTLAPSSQDNPLVGIWEGTLRFDNQGRTETIAIEELVVTKDLAVTGIYVISDSPSGTKLTGVITGGKIRSDRLEEAFFRFKTGAVANSRMDGPIEVVTVDGQDVLRSKTVEKLEKRFDYFKFGHRGISDDTPNFGAVLAMHRKTN